jgi:hypothetical protein
LRLASVLASCFGTGKYMFCTSVVIFIIHVLKKSFGYNK